MKTLNIVTMSLLFAAGSLFGRLDLQKVDKWKKEDSTRWTQAHVDEILKHINLPANKTGNEPLLNPLFKKIDEWKTEQTILAEAAAKTAEATRKKLADEAKAAAKTAEVTRKKLADEATAAAKTAEAARRKLADEATAAKAKLEEARIVEAQKEKARIAAEDEAKRLVDEKATQEKQAKAQADLEKAKLAEVAAEEKLQKERAVYINALDGILIQNAQSAAAADQKLKDALEENKRAEAEAKQLLDAKAKKEITDQAKLEGEAALLAVDKAKVLAALEKDKADKDETRIKAEKDKIEKEQAHDREVAAKAAKAEAAKAQATQAAAAAYIKETTATIQNLRNYLEEGTRLSEIEEGLLTASIDDKSFGEETIKLAREVLAINKALSDLKAQQLKFATDTAPNSRLKVGPAIKDIMGRKDVNSAQSVQDFGKKLLDKIAALDEAAKKVAEEKAAEERKETARAEAAKKMAAEKAAKEQEAVEAAAKKETAEDRTGRFNESTALLKELNEKGSKRRLAEKEIGYYQKSTENKDLNNKILASNKALKDLDFEKNFLTQDRALNEDELATRKANILEIKNRAEMKDVESVKTYAEELLNRTNKELAPFVAADDIMDKTVLKKIANLDSTTLKDITILEKIQDRYDQAKIASDASKAVNAWTADAKKAGRNSLLATALNELKEKVQANPDQAKPGYEKLFNTLTHASARATGLAETEQKPIQAAIERRLRNLEQAKIRDERNPEFINEMPEKVVGEDFSSIKKGQKNYEIAQQLTALKKAIESLGMLQTEGLETDAEKNIVLKNIKRIEDDAREIIKEETILYTLEKALRIKKDETAGKKK